MNESSVYVQGYSTFNYYDYVQCYYSNLSIYLSIYLAVLTVLSFIWVYVCLPARGSALGFRVSDFCHEAVAWKEDKQWHLETREERVSGDVLFRAVEQSA